MNDSRSQQQPSTSSDQQATGISNRETARDEAAERAAHPPLDPSSPPPQDAAGRVGEEPLDDLADRHTSHKTGSASLAQKEADVRYVDRPMPATRKVDGAFGAEPQDTGGPDDEQGGNA
jgi:hypothetical protein